MLVTPSAEELKKKPSGKYRALKDLAKIRKRKMDNIKKWGNNLRKNKCDESVSDHKPLHSYITLCMVINILWSYSKHEILNQCWFNVGPSSPTLGQQKINIGLASLVCWAVTMKIIVTRGRIPVNIGRSPNIDLMLGRSRILWTNIKSTLCQCTVFVDIGFPYVMIFLSNFDDNRIFENK